MTFKAAIDDLVETRKKGYCADINNITSNYGTDEATVKDYNGRQLLELLQNADDAKSDEVLITLDKTNNLLRIANKGKKCEPFTDKGVKSIMYVNSSSKTDNNNNTIGNKGLGFRSIINWADEIKIHSAGVELSFSATIAKCYYEKLTTKQEREKIQEDRNLLEGEIPMPILAIPKVEEKKADEWTTTISLRYKNDCLSDCLSDIEEQIGTIEAEILLFLKHLKYIKIDVDGNCKPINKPNNAWIIEPPEEGEVPAKYLDKEDKKYELQIAYNNELNNKGNEYLFSYFPTKINIGLPFIVHGTFELDISRNYLQPKNDKNKFIVGKLVEFIIKTAKDLARKKVNYQALRFLQYEHQDDTLNGLDFYTKIGDAIENEVIYPCIDDKCRKKSDIVYSNDFARFIEENGFSEDIPNLLKPGDNTFLNGLGLKNFRDIKQEDLKQVNEKIKDIDIRVEFIDYLVKNNYQEKIPILIDKDKNLINAVDEAYMPLKGDFSLPDYVQIKFIHQELFNGLINKFDLQEDIEKQKLEKLEQKLKNISNIKQYKSAEILEKIVDSTDTKLKDTSESDKPNLIKEMVRHLYINYKNHKPAISDQKIHLLDQNQDLKNAKDLYLSKTYPSGELTQELFGDIFSPSDFLADIEAFNLGDKKQEIEDFFLWLGVNKNTKLEDENVDKYSEYGLSIKSTHLKDEYHVYVKKQALKTIIDFENIKNISKENLIVWCLKGDIKDQLGNIELEVEGINKGRLSKTYNVENHILFQLKNLNFFDNYLISDNQKLNNFVNNEPVEDENELFKKYEPSKQEIEILLLKLGAVETFSELSFDKITQVLQSLPEKDREGKIAQTIYLESFKKHKEKDLNNDIKLFAKQGDKQDYFAQTGICYAGITKLPKEYTNKWAVFDYPQKPDSNKIADFFGIKDLGTVEPNNIKPDLAEINKKFQACFKKIKPYILAYRIEKIEKDKGKETKKIEDLSITLCQSINCEIDGEKYHLSDYDYLIDNKKYLIKVPNETLRTIRKKRGFYNVFGNIICLIFDLTDNANNAKFRNCIKDKEENTKDDITETMGTYAIIEAKKLLGISGDFYHFWHTIYQLKEKGKEYDKHNNKLALINNNLSIEVKDNDFKYEDINSKPKQIIDLFSQLEIKIVDFNNNTQGEKIDLSAYHQKELKNYFNNNELDFEQCLYQHCINESLQKEYLTKRNQYGKHTSDNYATQLEVDYQAECEEFIKKKFGFKLQNSENIISLNIDEIYSKNEAEKRSDSYLPDEIESLLYFEGFIDKVNQWIEDKEQSDQEESRQSDRVPEEKTFSIEPAQSATPNIDNSTPQTKSGRYNPESEKKQKIAGKKAETIAYNSLKKSEEYKNVKQVSKGDDNLGYDIKCNDKNGKLWHIEVKNRSKNVYMSKNEKKFAEENADSYILFLVDVKIEKIYPVYFDTLELVAEKYSVRYNLESN